MPAYQVKTVSGTLIGEGDLNHNFTCYQCLTNIKDCTSSKALRHVIDFHSHEGLNSCVIAPKEEV